MAVLALGSDTGGSVRQPASLCGIVGLKPTYGRVSRYGLVAFASSLDQISPFGKDVRDTALLFSVISGHDPKDSTSLKSESKNFAESLGKSERKFRVGVPQEALQAGNEKAVEEAFKNSLELMRRMGWQVEEISLKNLDYSIAAYYIVATAEASSNLARYDGVKYGYRAKDYRTLAEMYERTRGEGFGPEVKRRIMLGTYVLSAGYYEAYYGKGQKVRTLIKRDFEEAFKNFDVIVMPTSPTVAFGLGEKVEDPLAMYLSDIFTTVANLAGIPAISIPMGKSKEGLPIGLQILAPALREDLIFEAAYGLEQSLKI
jgi:aspartyl-tRNA(Asn)/glutamyl-tRNA(Gln) amidotransferase subunit A